MDASLCASMCLLASDCLVAFVLLNKVCCISLQLFRNVFTLPASGDPPTFLTSKYESHSRRESRLPPRAPGYWSEWEMVVLEPAHLEVQGWDVRMLESGCHAGFWKTVWQKISSYRVEKTFIIQSYKGHGFCEKQGGREMRNELFRCYIPLHAVSSRQLSQILLTHSCWRANGYSLTKLRHSIAVDTLAVFLKCLYSQPWLRNSTILRGNFTNSTRPIWSQPLGSPRLGYLWEVMVMDRWGGKHPFQCYLVTVGASVLFWLVPHLPQRNSGLFGKSHLIMCLPFLKIRGSYPNN